jgi:hypothetical protein
MLALHAVMCQARTRMDKETVARVMREMGRKGGKIGGKKSLETMTPEERTARAKKAAAASAKSRAKKR